VSGPDTLGTVRAAVFDGPGSVSVEELELERPHAHEVLVRMGASGVCHSDLHVVDGEWPRPAPVVMGHEGAGVVEAVGEGVRGVAVGDHVVLSWFYACRRCSHCLAGRAWACSGTMAGKCVMDDGTTRFRRTGSGEDVYTYLAVGSMAERSVVPETAAIPIPREVPMDVAALIGCAVTTGVGAVVNTARVEAGSSVVVIGCGGVGLSVVMGAALAGAHPIVAVDLSDEKRALAVEVGATDAVGTVEDAAARMPGGFDYAFEAIGLVPTVEAVPGLVRPGGVGVLVGLAAYGERASFEVYSFVDGGKTLVGSIYGGAVPALDFPRIARLYLAGKLPLDRLVSHRIGLEDVDEAFAAMRRRERARSVVVFE
jgi:S-(hydroxymethyl)glutathione dehydrogenase/alcohol dehydrogenase